MGLPFSDSCSLRLDTILHLIEIFVEIPEFEGISISFRQGNCPSVQEHQNPRPNSSFAIVVNMGNEHEFLK